MAIVQHGWYETLVTDCKQIIVSAKNNAGMVLIEAKYDLGNRILPDYQKFGRSEYGFKTQEDLANDLETDQGRVSENINFAKKVNEEHGNFTQFTQSIDPSILSWKKLLREWLPKKKRLKAIVTPISEELSPIKLFNDDFMNAYKEIEAESIDFIITDPPYGREYIDLYDGLGMIANKLLKEGGSLIAMSGQSYLPKIMGLLNKHLNYNWVAAYLTPGAQSAQLWQRKVNTFWKPLLWYTKGKYEGKWIGDVATSKVNDNDKRFMGWQQSETGMADIIERFTEPNDIVLDPFMGSGTTGWCALSLSRQFIGIEIDHDIFEIAYERLGGNKKEEVK